MDETGLAYAFTSLKKALEPIIDCFDHAFLDEIPPFDELNPSSKNIARAIYEALQQAFEGAHLHSV